MPLDLHIHSTVSDGTLSPAEIVRVAVELGLSAVALADHDSVGGVREALQAATGTSLCVIPAVEINTDVGEREAHLLGYFVDVDAEGLNRQLQAIRRARVERAGEMVRRLNGLGIPLSMSDVVAASAGESLGRPHVARALVAGGHCRSETEAFDRYLRIGRPAYVPRHRLSAGDAIRLIRSAGGVPVLAHPALLRDDGLIARFREEGLMGLEAHHCEHSHAVAQHYVKLAHQYGLIVTGGSDSHGPLSRRPVAIGSVSVPDSVLPALQAAAQGLQAARVRRED